MSSRSPNTIHQRRLFFTQGLGDRFNNQHVSLGGFVPDLRLCRPFNVLLQ